MALPHAQPWQDWFTQLWNIALGRRVRVPADSWLLGPRGEPGGIGEEVISQIARKEDLAIERDAQTVGLLHSFERFGNLAALLRPEIARFYLATSSYEFDVWTKWEAGWGQLGRLVDVLFARRLAQLSLPLDPMDTNRGIGSEIIALRAPNGSVQHRIWLRKLKSRGSTIYSGFYDVTVTPAGEPCVKVVFPLPKGSATVILRAILRPDGGLRLESAGRRDGDPGFYFTVEDRKGTLWVHYLRCFHEWIDVYVDLEGVLRADHIMTLWGRRVYSLHYRMTLRCGGPTESVERPAIGRLQGLSGVRAPPSTA